MSNRHSEVCEQLAMLKSGKLDSQMSLGAQAGMITDLVLRHPESQPQPDIEIERLRKVLDDISKWPERRRDPDGMQHGPEWMLYDIREYAKKAMWAKREGNVG